MPKHINSDTIKFLIKYNADKITQDVSASVILKLIDEMPGIEIVRCRDCKYYHPKTRGCDCECEDGLNCPDANDYCSYGKRRKIK